MVLVVGPKSKKPAATSSDYTSITLAELSRYGSGLLGLTLMNRHPNIAFFAGTVVIAIMFVVAFANVANAGDCPRSKSAEATAVEVKEQADKKAEVEA